MQPDNGKAQQIRMELLRAGLAFDRGGEKSTARISSTARLLSWIGSFFA